MLLLGRKICRRGRDNWGVGDIKRSRVSRVGKSSSSKGGRGHRGCGNCRGIWNIGGIRGIRGSMGFSGISKAVWVVGGGRRTQRTVGIIC